MSKDKMTYEQAMAMALEHMQNGEPELEVVGTIPDEKLTLLYDLDEVTDDHDQYHEEMKRKIEAYADSLEEEHKPRCDEMKKQIHKIYKQIFESAGLDADDFYGVPVQLNLETGEIRVEKKGPVN